MLLNLFQVRLRAKDAPEDHVAEGTVRAEPGEVHPGEATQVVVDLSFPEGGAPGSIDVKVSPPEDFTAGPPEVVIREDGATVTIRAETNEEVELGTYYLQVVYADDAREHFEAEAPLEVKRHWVRVGDVRVTPSRASPGDPVDVSVVMAFEGGARVRGHVRGRLVPEEWDGEDEHAIKLPRERSSVTDEREQVWHVRLPRSALHGVYHADVEFSSQEGMARRRAREVMRLVPPYGIDAGEPVIEPDLLAPGDPVTITARTENVGREPLELAVGGELVPEVGGAAMPLEERALTLAPGESRDVSWSMAAPDRHGHWLVRLRARTGRAEGADPPQVVMDVRPPNRVHVVGAVPSRPWASPGEAVDVLLRLLDDGSRPGSEAGVEVCLEGEAGETGSTGWRGWIGPEQSEAVVKVTVPSPVRDGEGSHRFSIVVRGTGGEELLRVPSAVAVRKRVRIVPRVVKAMPDPTRVGDALLPGERVAQTHDAGPLTIMELTSGCRIYARGDQVVGVDEDLPMDDEFWDDALDAEIRLYTDLMNGLKAGSRAARSEAIAMRAVADALGKGEAGASGLVKDTRELARTVDPDKRARGVSPRSGPLAPLAAWLADPSAPPSRGREVVTDLRQQASSGERASDRAEAAAVSGAAARTASDHLERLAELMERARSHNRLGTRNLRAMTGLVAAAGVAEVEHHRLREAADPWVTPQQAMAGQKTALQSMSSQLALLVELDARHRLRRAAGEANTRQRAAQAAVARDLEVSVEEGAGHSGDATTLDLLISNRSAVDLELVLNVALPSGAWAVLEPQARGSEGLVSVGPVRVPARGRETLPLVVYVPTTVKLSAYTIPIEVVPRPRDVVPEQGGGKT